MSSAEHLSLQQRFERKEKECEARSKEKEDILEMLNKMKEKLEREVSEHKQAKVRAADLSAQLQQLRSVSQILRSGLSSPAEYQKFTILSSC